MHPRAALRPPPRSVLYRNSRVHPQLRPPTTPLGSSVMARRGHLSIDPNSLSPSCWWPKLGHQLPRDVASSSCCPARACQLCRGVPNSRSLQASLLVVVATLTPGAAAPPCMQFASSSSTSGGSSWMLLLLQLLLPLLRRLPIPLPWILRLLWSLLLWNLQLGHLLLQLRRRHLLLWHLLPWHLLLWHLLLLLLPLLAKLLGHPLQAGAYLSERRPALGVGAPGHHGARARKQRDNCMSEVSFKVQGSGSGCLSTSTPKASLALQGGIAGERVKFSRGQGEDCIT